LGSFFAGIKAGTLSGILYVGGLAVFNVVLLLVLKTDVLSAISQSYSNVCTSAPQVNGSLTPSDCYSLILSVDVPYVAFIGFLITIVFMGVFGLFYEWLPGKGPIPKGETVALVIGVSLLLFGFYGFSFNYVSGLATGVFLLLWTPVFGYVAGRLYRRYTGLVSFNGDQGKVERIIVDGRDLTGKTRTFALKSTHAVKAEVGESSFKGWNVGGGVKVEDSRSYDTVMEVNGDGTISILSTSRK
jgi:hypothetical protein